MTWGIKFVGNPEDHTGYGRAGLYMLEALYSAGVSVLLRSVKFLPNPMALPTHIKAMLYSKLSYNIVLIELTPEHFPIYRESGKYNIGYFFWETDRIPDYWVECCNSMQEIWVPCRSNANACIKSGVTVPVKIVPQPTPLQMTDGRVVIPGSNSDTYVFYSVFQWTVRKNPECLLGAYWSAFHNSENVVLVLKTYSSSDSAKDIAVLKAAIMHKRAQMEATLKVPGSKLPSVYFLSKVLTDEQIDRLQNSGHCFVTAARGEGWNIPAASAIMAGKPIISPASGGIVDYLNADQYLSVSCNAMIPVAGMPWIKWYESKQRWCDPSEQDLANRMRQAFDGKIKSAQYGKLVEDVSIAGCGKIIAEMLKSIK